MLKQHLYISKYDWEIDIYYHVTCYYIEEIINKLECMGCSKSMIKDAYENMSACRLNSGLTCTNGSKHKSVVVISKTSSPKEFLNSLFHELYHVVAHIIEQIGIDPYSEEAAYLSGDIAQRVYYKAKHFLCKCNH